MILAGYSCELLVHFSIVHLSTELTASEGRKSDSLITQMESLTRMQIVKLKYCDCLYAHMKHNLVLGPHTLLTE